MFTHTQSPKLAFGTDEYLLLFQNAALDSKSGLRLADLDHLAAAYSLSECNSGHFKLFVRL